MHQVWTGSFWNSTSLDALGYTFHLGHNGERCPNPFGTKVLNILHTNGFHRLKTVFCSCHELDLDTEPRQQLLNRSLYPASDVSPASAFTFDCLDVFVQLSSQSSLSTHDFYLSMRQVTDNPDLEGWPVRNAQTSICIALMCRVIYNRNDTMS